jgi:hypothetical protein
MTEVTETKKQDEVTLKNMLNKRVCVDGGKIIFLNEAELTHPRVSELLTIVKVTQVDIIPEILVDSVTAVDAKKHMEEWNEWFRTESPHLSPAMYRTLLLGDFWGQNRNQDYYNYIANTNKTAVAIFGDPNTLSGRPQHDDIVPGLEAEFCKELGIDNLDELSNPKL